MYTPVLIPLTSLLYLYTLLLSPIQALNCNATFPTTSQTPYPTRAQICHTFSHLAGANANYTLFFEHVLDDVNWTIEGTHALAGRYNNKTVLEAAFVRIDDTGSQQAPLIISIVNVIGGGEQEWSVEELQVLGVCRNGTERCVFFFLAVTNLFKTRVEKYDADLLCGWLRRAEVRQPLRLGHALEYRGRARGS